MKDFLLANGFSFEGDFLRIPDYAKTIKLDVGLSVNAPQSAVWLAAEPELFVFGFEPVSKNREAIMSGISPWPTNLNPDLVGEKIMIVPCALGNISMPDGLDMFITKKDPGCSSLLEPIEIEVDYKETVPLFRLQDFLDCFPFHLIPHIDHIKIDVQGTDIDVLRGLGDYLTKIMAVTIEIDTRNYHMTQNSSKGVTALLRAHGFRKIHTGRMSRIYRMLRGYQIELQVDDPTFINKKKIALTRKRRYFLFQRG
jgi:FkbM family methyltransferase